MVSINQVRQRFGTSIQVVGRRLNADDRSQLLARLLLPEGPYQANRAFWNRSENDTLAIQVKRPTESQWQKLLKWIGGQQTETAAQLAEAGRLCMEATSQFFEKRRRFVLQQDLGETPEAFLRRSLEALQSILQARIDAESLHFARPAGSA